MATQAPTTHWWGQEIATLPRNTLIALVEQLAAENDELRIASLKAAAGRRPTHHRGD